MGYFSIPDDIYSPKRTHQAVSQTISSPRRGDLIISNWTSYIDVLYLAARYNPTFLLPVFTPLPSSTSSTSSSSTSSSSALSYGTGQAGNQGRKTGRHTGTGSANISLPSSLSTTSPSSFDQPTFLGYVPISLPAILSRTGSLPPQFNQLPLTGYKTLKEARRREMGPVVVFPEGTTSNGRAVLRFGEGVLADEEFRDQKGIIWIKYFK